MYTVDQVKQIVLKYVNRPELLCADEFVIYDLYQSDDKDYWIVFANSRSYVETGDFSKLYVGIGAYMLNNNTGEIETVGSQPGSIHNYIQDKYDLKIANGKKYVLSCGYEKTDKKAIMYLHKNLSCTIEQAKYLIVQKRDWFTGKKRYLLELQEQMINSGYQTVLRTSNNTSDLIQINSDNICTDAIKELL